MSALLDATGLEQAAAIRGGEVSAEELARGYLERIARHDARLHAFVQVLGTRALRAARSVDRRRARKSTAAGPVFHGVPFAIKDTDPVRFAWNRAGSRAYRYAWTPADSPAVRLLRRAGLVILGKTATSELALMPVVETDLQPPTANPWNPAHSSGGSSGGSAAAVAAGFVALAHAADGAGSIRIPASFCHLFGFKPSRGLTPDFYAKMDHCGLSTMGSVSHSVDDTAAVLDVLCGRTTFPPAPDSLLARTAEAPPKGLRVHLCLRSPLGIAEPEVTLAVQSVARALADLGHHVEPVEPTQGALDEFLPIYQYLAARPPTLGDGVMQPVTRWLREAGRRVTLAQALAIRDQLQRRVVEWFGTADLLLTPTVGRLAPRVNEWSGLAPEPQFRAAAELGGFTAVFNVSGQPSASVPAGISASGLPIGAMLTARAGDDVRLLQVCRSLEQALGWRARRAAMSAQPPS